MCPCGLLSVVQMAPVQLLNHCPCARFCSRMRTMRREDVPWWLFGGHLDSHQHGCLREAAQFD